MKKIVVDARMIKSSGIGTYLQSMLPNLPGNYNPVLLGKTREIKALGLEREIEIINFTSPIYSLSEQLMFPVKIPGCDIFLSPHYNVPVLPVKAGKKIVIIHDVYHLAFYGRLTGLQKLYAKYMIRKAVKNSDSVITVSKFSKSEIVKYTGVDETKISVVYCGLNKDVFKDFYNGDYSGLIQKYKLPDKFFLFVSNIKPHKNLYNLLAAFLEILEKDEKYKIVVVGEYKKLITADKDVFKLLDKSPKLKRNTVFTGYISRQELNALYRMAFALVFPSLYEGFGLPPLEAMICGCPVIAASTASIPEACGDAALYFDPYNVHDIKEKLELFINDESYMKVLTAKGRENIKRFSRENFAANLKMILDPD